MTDDMDYFAVHHKNVSTFRVSRHCLLHFHAALITITDHVLSLPPTYELRFGRLSLFVCLSTRSSDNLKVMNGFAWNFYQRCVSG